MHIQGTWAASTAGPERSDPRDLTALAGRWASEVNVEFANSAAYSHGPVELHYTLSRPQPATPRRLDDSLGE